MLPNFTNNKAWLAYWYQFVGNRIPHTTMPILMLQSDQVWIFGIRKECGLFICAQFIFLVVNTFVRTRSAATAEVLDIHYSTKFPRF